MAQLTTISADELQKHASESDCWLAIHGKVYDVTNYLVDHPGGLDVMMEHAGANTAGLHGIALFRVATGRGNREEGSDNKVLRYCIAWNSFSQRYRVCVISLVRLNRTATPATVKRAFVMARTNANSALSTSLLRIFWILMCNKPIQYRNNCLQERMQLGISSTTDTAIRLGSR
jgi:hypothetical protein